MDGVVITLPASSGGTVEVTVLFNREGPVGGMIAIGKDAPLRPFTTTIQSQSGIF